MTWQLPEGRDLTTWWKPVDANTSAVTPVMVQFKDEANVDNNQEGQCYQNVFGVYLGDSSQYPSVVNSGKRNINKKVLLCERKRHTARHVVSTHSVVLSWLTPPADAPPG